MEIFKEFAIEAAHWLPNVPAGHKCGRLHGHSFHVTVHVRGPLDPQLGWVIDFAEIRTAFKGIEDRIDHRCLNEVGGLENPNQRESGAMDLEGAAACASIAEQDRGSRDLHQRLHIYRRIVAGY